MPRKKIGRLSSLYAAVAAVLVACSTPSQAPAPEPTPAASAPSTSSASDVGPRRHARAGTVAKPPVVDTRSDADKANAACRGSDGVWHCSLPQPHLMAAGANGTPGNCGPVCSVTQWYLDPANSVGCAADSNSGTAATCTGGCTGSVCASGIGPVLTMAQLVSRYGTPSPKINFGLTLTVTWLSSQTINTDVFRFDPLVTGAGNFVELGGATGTGTRVGTTFSPTSVTAKVQTASGAPLKLVFTGSIPAGMAAGQLIQNTSLGSWATVYKIVGLVVSVTQPLAGAGLTTVTPFPTIAEDNAWAAGNTYQLWSTVGVNQKNIEPSGGDENSSFTDGVAWYQGLTVFDTSGVVGSSTAMVRAHGIPITISMSLMQPYLVLDSLYNGGGTNLAGSQANGGVFIYSSVYGGALNISASDFSHCFSFPVIDADCVVDGSLVVETGRALINSALLTGTTTVHGGGSLDNGASFAGATQLVYGPGTVNLAGGGIYHLIASTFTNALKMATIELDGATVFDTYLPSSGTWVNHAGPFTSANIDTGGGAGGAGVQNARTGSRYSPVN